MQAQDTLKGGKAALTEGGCPSKGLPKASVEETQQNHHCDYTTENSFSIVVLKRYFIFQWDF